MDMKIEFDERVLTGGGYRLDDYMKAFKDNGMWKTKIRHIIKAGKRYMNFLFLQMRMIKSYIISFVNF
ncbi:hypothetical protein SAMN05216357_12043 [Porphyromonadaceae bacterium KH3CP3RA]|nr:hypothetical protein SAMN05216357_12043 [Porphyromonadaceae bacterium KH3CP3RA]